MRVRATALGSEKSNAIGQVELTCTPVGLTIGLFGVGAYAPGYATGAMTSGTQVTLPYSSLSQARVVGRQLFLSIDAEGFPYDRLVLSQFSPGPGVPLREVRRRRLILHVSALSVAAIACVAATLLVPTAPRERLAWGALAYGALAGSLILVLGFALDRSLYVRPAREDETRNAFVADLSRYVPTLAVSGPQPRTKVRRFDELWTRLPRSAAAIGVLMAAAVLTAVVGGQRILATDSASQGALASREGNLSASPQETRTPRAPPRSAPSSPTNSLPSDREHGHTNLAPAPTRNPARDEAVGDGPRPATVERHCACDRADSELWRKPIPRLSSLLIEKRAIPLKNYTRTELQVAVINNGDSPIDEITLHVQFYEQKGKERTPTKERPLYYEGPLRPGQAVKWSTRARGTEFDIATPDLGTLGPGGSGAAPAAAFVELLEANHRPVRLHAARMLSYLGDSRAREAAMHLKDAMRAAEAPYLRRLLMATGDIRVCDVEAEPLGEDRVGACVYNASGEQQSEVGIQINELSGSLDADHPLADPPEQLRHEKWILAEPLEPQAGQYVRLTLPVGFVESPDHALEVMADRYDLLD